MSCALRLAPVFGVGVTSKAVCAHFDFVFAVGVNRSSLSHHCRLTCRVPSLALPTMRQAKVIGWDVCMGISGAVDQEALDAMRV